MIRLNKVTKDLNVGIKTLVDYLRKKGFKDIDENPNAKITDEQYAELKKGFSSDQSLRKESDKFIQDRQNRDRNKETVQIDGYNEPEKVTTENKPVEEVKTVIPEDRIPQFKPVGKIDLDSLNKKPKQNNASDEEVVQPKAATESEPQAKHEEAEVKHKVMKEEPQTEPEKEPVHEQAKQQPAVTMEPMAPAKEEVKPVVAGPTPTVVPQPIVVEQKPVEAEPKPVATEPKSVEPASAAVEQKPVEATKELKSVEAEQKPVATEQKPVENKPKPVEAEQKPAEDRPKFKKIMPNVSKPKPEPIPEPEKKEALPEEKKPAEGVVKAEAPEKPVEKATEEEIFRIHTTPTVSTINVLGKIDLDALNQTTRPKKKTKEEKKKEREDKEKQRIEMKKQMRDAIMKEIKGNNPSDANAQKKHRNRINKVDVSAEVNAGNNPQKKNNRPQGQNNGFKPNPKGNGGANNGNNGNNGKQFKPQNNQNGGNNAGNGNGNGNNNAKRGKDRYKKQAFRPEVNDEDVAKQVKETLARLTNKSHSKTSKYRKEKRESAFNRQHEEDVLEEKQSKVLKLTEFVTANELASMMDVPVTKIIGTCMSIGMMVSINQRLDAETINLVAEEFGYKTEYVSADVTEAVNEEEDSEEDLQPRAPIVTVMGHVDHGKTSLLDYVRKANVIAGEAGGITQHIGAYNVKLEDGRHITFLDTPGHEAFTAMRARGAKVTDIAIIIVAADDNVMPQTKEAINHASAAGVPIVFAINKIDRPTANPDKIKEELAGMNYLVEEWGGKYQSQDISAKKGIGVKDLLEKVLLEAELLDLKANPDRKATGSIIESSLDKGRGYVATILVSNGTLKVGDVVLAGTHFGRVKAMFNERNQRIEQAGPSEPALILGLDGAPAAGDIFHVIETEQEARDIANKRQQLQREQGLRTHKMLTLDEVGRRIALGSFQELNIIVKGDVDGSIEALSDSLIKLSTQQIQVNVIHKAVGQISESDVSLAAASQAIIIGFQVRPSLSARKLAEQEGVDIRTYSIIYDAIEEVKAAMIGMLQPVLKEEITAQLEVREVFHITKAGTVAGALVKEGKVKRTDKARLIRDGIVIFTGEINALKRFKDDVKEVAVNFECGISLVNYNDIQVGDVIETFQEVEVKQTL